MSELQKAIYRLDQARQITAMIEEQVRSIKEEISESELGLQLAEFEESAKRLRADEAAARAALDEVIRR